MNSCSVFAYLLLVSIFCGCRKNEEYPEYHGKIKNKLGAPTTIDFYSSRTDYDKRTNVSSTIVIEPGGDYLIPNVYEGGAKWYIDFYSPDYGYTNWGSDPMFLIPNISPELDPAMTIEPIFTNVRKIFLNGNDLSTRWKAVDAKSGSSSKWSTLTENQKTREIVINRNLTGTYTYKDNDGAVQTMNFTFESFSSATSTSWISVKFTIPIPGTVTTTLSAVTQSGVVNLNLIQAPSIFPPTNTGTSYTYYYERQ